jgi:hypothetical protein
MRNLEARKIMKVPVTRRINWSGQDDGINFCDGRTGVLGYTMVLEGRRDILDELITGYTGIQKARSNLCHDCLVLSTRLAGAWDTTLIC